MPDSSKFENHGSHRDATLLGEDASSSSTVSIGAYQLLRKLGDGGMGEVWLAEQTVPIRRTVALKLIKAGMDTSTVVARFQAERQALALMDHPQIAKVFDAASTEEGRPFFVMEYVPGIPITDYCDRHRLTIRERLELFILVCNGVQHAHQKAIIHRDLKPSNVLVYVQGDKPIPKIIDFGLAKATGQSLTEKTIVTQLGVMVGTPSYMSPEQANLTDSNIDTRTDVYSLGVILYELLVGALPFDHKKVSEIGLDALLRKIREEDPLPPSAKIRSSEDLSKSSAELRREEPRSFEKRIRGDLDWITLKALEKDRTRRYGSPSELAADIGRHLRDEPVLARPPSPVYRTGKFVRRHKFSVSIAAVAAVFLLGFAVTMAVQARRIALERDRANREAEASKRVADFMSSIFTLADPSETRGNTVTAREILDNASKQIDPGLAKDPILQARMMDTMGWAYYSLGLLHEARPLMVKSLEIRQRVLGAEHPDTLKSEHSLAALLNAEGRAAESEKVQREALKIQLRVLGPKDYEVLRSMNTLAVSLENLDRYSEAEDVYRQALEAARTTLGPEDSLRLTIATNLSLTLARQQKYAEAEKLTREVLDVRRRAFGPDNPDTADAMLNLAYIVSASGENGQGLQEAERLTREALVIFRRVYPPENPSVLQTTNNLAAFLRLQGQNEEAEKLLRETLDIEVRVLGEGNRTTAMTKYNLAMVAAAQKRWDESFRILRDAFDHGLPLADQLALEEEPGFSSMHKDPRYISLVADAHRRADAVRKTR
jgi:non-specific serine/threonine protein kinase/serine/threonine-protein kinase